MKKEKANEKDLKLVNIYIRIHNKRALTLDDLAYLAKYNPECFKKTCDNLIYKMPEAKALVESEPKPTEKPARRKRIAPQTRKNLFEATADEKLQDERMIRRVIDNLKNIESGKVETIQAIDTEQVKELLGDLFMENVFPHNGVKSYLDVGEDDESTFNVKV